MCGEREREVCTRSSESRSEEGGNVRLSNMDNRIVETKVLELNGYTTTQPLTERERERERGDNYSVTAHSSVFAIDI